MFVCNAHRVMLLVCIVDFQGWEEEEQFSLISQAYSTTDAFFHGTPIKSFWNTEVLHRTVWDLLLSWAHRGA